MSAKRLSWSALFIYGIGVLALLLPPKVEAAGDPCVLALTKSVSKYVSQRWKAISKCEQLKADGKIADTENCRPADGPVTDAKTANSLSKAATKLETKLSKKCTGPLPPLGPDCNTAATVTDLVACVTAAAQEPDVAPANADTLLAAIYPSAGSMDSTCLKKISKAAGSLLKKRISSMSKCQTLREKGKISGACPDAKVLADVTKALEKFDKKILAGCSMTAVSSPDLVFGEPCDLFISSVYNRAAGGSINNTIPPLLRFMRCVSDLTATVSDHANVLGNPQPPTSPFAEGVAAGDATDTAVVFWTRLPDPNAPATLEIATDPDFTNIVQTVSTSSPAGADGTVKEDVGGLSPSTVYYYRFTQGSDVSPVGRVKTAPAPTDAVPVRFAITGDANPYFRPYSVLDVLRLQDVDGWFYIGDTVYSDDDRGDGFIADQLAEYQQKHRESRVDTPLREMMRNFATYVQWDDHESVNDISGTVPAFQSRLIDGNQAFRQYFPIREDPGDPMQLYRKFQWGTSAEFYLLDLRQYRSPKIVCCEPPDPPIVEINFDPGTLGECPLGGQVILPDPACQAALADPSRTYIGTAQKQWLKNSLLSSTATFKFILNGPPITQFGMQPYDRWEAWPAERTEILDFIEANNIKNVIWLSTDFHALIASEQSVDADFAHSIPEVVVGAIGMDTILREIVSAAPSIVPLLPALPALIPQVTAYDIDRFNGAVVTVDPNASPPTATLDAYGRSGEVLLSTTFEAAP